MSEERHFKDVRKTASFPAISFTLYCDIVTYKHPYLSICDMCSCAKLRDHARTQTYMHTHTLISFV